MGRRTLISNAILFLLPLLLVTPALASLSFIAGILGVGGANNGVEAGPGGVPANTYATDYLGDWKLVKENAGVSSMHIAVTNKGKVIMFDDTNLGPSTLLLPPGKCRPLPGSKTGEIDCWAHAVEFDPETAEIRPLRLMTDTWCSSGGFSPDGRLVQTGGWKEGQRSVRYLDTCPTCDWMEYPDVLAPDGRWYGTQQILANGQHIVIGGRRMYSYEYVPPPGKPNPAPIPLTFLEETTDQLENNLYPFVHLNTDGNIFLFANDRAILLDPVSGKTVKRYPVLEGGARNYPGSGMSALLPLSLAQEPVNPEVIVCGGSDPQAFRMAEKGTFLPAVRSCGRIFINDPYPQWAMEEMPMARTMSDMLILPNGELLMINGAEKGCSAWDFARDPVLTPVLYRHEAVGPADRFRTLKATTIPRVYHSNSAVLPDASVLVAGSNTNAGYKFVGVMYPTELRVEKFYPPYLDPALEGERPVVNANALPPRVFYGKQYQVGFGVFAGENLRGEDLKVTMYAPPFTTHGFSMNQRLVELKRERFEISPVAGKYEVTVTMPENGNVTPPGYYMLFVVNRGIPSKAVWVQIV